MVAALKHQSTHNSYSLSSIGITADSKIIIVGLGVTGVSVLRYLLQQGIYPEIVDNRAEPPGLHQYQQEFKQDWPVLKVTTGEQAFDNLGTATHLIVSPGLALTTPEIDDALNKGVKLVSDIDLFANQASAPIIAITGSNGKTTVTTLVGKMIESAGYKVGVGGNIGTPALDLLQVPDLDFYVLELSSFQLERTTQLKSAAAVVLNLSEDHMDRYDGLSDYASAKVRVFSGTSLIVENYCEPSLEVLTSNTHQKTISKVYFGLTNDAKCHFRLDQIDKQEWLVAYNKPLVPVAEVAMQGRHNISNALAALALIDAVNIKPDFVIDTLREFSGLPHRMEFVGQKNGIHWINDSKATNIGACQAALEGMDGQVVLIAGGDAKGADFSGLRTTIMEKVSLMIVLGKDASILQSAFQKFVKIHRVKTIDEAVDLAAELAQPGDTVMLSPACASLDQFKNYQARGDAFRDAIKRLSK